MNKCYGILPLIIAVSLFSGICSGMNDYCDITEEPVKASAKNRLLHYATNYLGCAKQSVLYKPHPCGIMGHTQFFQMSEEEFANNVIDVANSFGNNPNIGYRIIPQDETQGNCNTNSSAILHKAGVSTERIKEIRDKIPGIVIGFGSYKLWTIQEQNKAMERQKLNNYRLSF